MLQQVVVVQNGGRYTLSGPCGTDVHADSGEQTSGRIGVPQRVVGRDILDESGRELLPLLDDLVLKGAANDGSYDVTDSAGLAVLLNPAVDQVVGVQPLVGQGQQVLSLEVADRVTHLVGGGGLVDRGESGGVHGVPSGQHDYVVGHDVPESVSSTLVQLRDIENGPQVGSQHVDGLRVSSPDSGLNHGSIEHVHVELVDDGLGHGGGYGGESSGVLGTSLYPDGRNGDDHSLSTIQRLDLGIVVLGGLDTVGDPLLQLISVRH